MVDAAVLRSRSRALAKRSLLAASGLVTCDVDRQATIERLRAWAVTDDPPGAVDVPASVQHGTAEVFGAAERFVPPHGDLVWDVPRDAVDGPVRLTRHGGLRMGRDLLDTDFGTGSGALDLRPGRTRELAGDVVAPWSHHWGREYYDWVVMVLGKLLRIREALGPSRWSGATLALAHTGTAFARWYLDELGVLDRVVDPRQGPRFAPQRVQLGTSQPWFRPSRDDLVRIREAFLPSADGLDGLGPVVYVQRTGRRRVRNERALLGVLDRHGVQVMEDGVHAVPEQVAIFRDARVVVAPHGAGLANLLYASPGTTVLELFGPRYRADPFRWMAAVLGMEHHVLASEPRPGSRPVRDDADVHAAVAEDYDVEPCELDAALARLLAPGHGAGARSVA